MSQDIFYIICKVQLGNFLCQRIIGQCSNLTSISVATIQKQVNNFEDVMVVQQLISIKNKLV